MWFAPRPRDLARMIAGKLAAEPAVRALAAAGVGFALGWLLRGLR